MKLDLKFGMPELLVLYSLMMYGQDKFTAIAALVLGIVGRLIGTMVSYGNQHTQKSLEEKESPGILAH